MGRISLSRVKSQRSRHTLCGALKAPTCRSLRQRALVHNADACKLFRRMGTVSNKLNIMLLHVETNPMGMCLKIGEPPEMVVVGVISSHSGIPRTGRPQNTPLTHSQYRQIWRAKFRKAETCVVHCGKCWVLRPPVSSPYYNRVQVHSLDSCS